MNVLRLHRYRWLAGLVVVGIMQRLDPWARAEDTVWLKSNGPFATVPWNPYGSSTAWLELNNPLFIAPWNPYAGSGWLLLDYLPMTSTGVDVDASHENNRVGGTTSTYNHLFVTPFVGFGSSGSIYHPNLISYNITSELGWGWDHTSTTSPGFKQTQNGSDFMNRYLAQVNLLPSKPYNASFFAAQDHTYQDYGSFDTFTVDSTRYGGRLSEDTGTLSLNADFGYRNENDSGFTGDSEISETYLNFVGIQKRPSGQTTLTYHINQYDNTLNSSNSPGSTVSSLTQSVGASDSESFGQHKQITATTGATYSESQYSGQQLDAVNATENVNFNHSPKLDSFLMFNFGTYQLHPATADNLQGSYTVRHQLYESLTSSPDVHGSYSDNSNPTSSSSTDRYGVGLYEGYTKRLTSQAHLSAGLGGIVDHEDDHSSGGVATIIDEPHQLYLPTSPSFRPVYLNQPNVVPGSIQVTAGGSLLVAGTDYQVITSGDLTQIQLIVPPSSHVLSLLGGNPNAGLLVLATYESDSLNNASYEIYTASGQIRVDLFDHYGVYGRWNWSGNNAPSGTVVQSLTDVVIGGDYTLKWLRAGVEYEDYNCNFSQYQAARAFQNFNFRLDDKSTLGLNFNQSFYRYSDGGTQSQFLSLCRYNIQIFTSLAWYVEGGGSAQNILGTDSFQGAARTGINWSRGKLSVRTGYEYNNQYTSTGSWSQDLVKNRFFLYLKRVF